MRKIVIDIYGADLGPEECLEGIALTIREEDFFPVIVGEEALIRSVMNRNGIKEDAYEVIHTTDYITNEEPATVIFGGRDNSSVALGYKRLKEDAECPFGRLYLPAGSNEHRKVPCSVQRPALRQRKSADPGGLRCDY